MKKNTKQAMFHDKPALQAADELVRLRKQMAEVIQEAEGWVDGAPDCSPASRLANRIIAITEGK